MTAQKLALSRSVQVAASSSKSIDKHEQGCIQNFFSGGGTFKLKKNTVELIVAQYEWNFNVVSNAFCNTNNS